MTFVLLELDDPVENARTVGQWDWPELLDTPNLVGVGAFDTIEETVEGIAQLLVAREGGKQEIGSYLRGDAPEIGSYLRGDEPS